MVFEEDTCWHENSQTPNNIGDKFTITYYSFLQLIQLGD